MNPAFNPQPTYLCNTEQTDMFIFMTEHGFCAMVFEEVEGFLADSDPDSLAALGSKVFAKDGTKYYFSVESVPDLVSRYTDMKRRRAAAGEQAKQQLAASLKPQGVATSTWKK